MLRNENSFTLIELVIELVIVLGILAILAVVVVLILNPSEFLKQTRDSKRLSELQTLNKALASFQIDRSKALQWATPTLSMSLFLTLHLLALI